MRNNGVEKKNKNKTKPTHIAQTSSISLCTIINHFQKSLRIQNKLGQELGVRRGSKSNAQFGGRVLLNLNQTMTTISHNSHL